jgi:hypothetical protein
MLYCLEISSEVLMFGEIGFDFLEAMSYSRGPLYITGEDSLLVGGCLLFLDYREIILL